MSYLEDQLKNIKAKAKLKKMKEESRYNPRPDLKEDVHLWRQVLKMAEKVDKFLYGGLHGFRCAGCRLKLKEGQLNLIRSDHWKSEEEYKRDRKEYLMPYKEEIIKILEQVSRSEAI